MLYASLELVGLRPKVYNLLLYKCYDVETCKLIAKGVKKSFVEKRVRHMYRETLLTRKAQALNFLILDRRVIG